MMGKKTFPLTHLGLALVIAIGFAPTARAWDPFRSESSDVRRGNEHLQKGQHAEALEAYETASRKLPKDSGVQLNRGLALMASDKLDAAREAFKLATQGSASREVRAESYYDLGLAFMQQAEAASKADKLDEAQGFLRESVDAFKSSLRNGPKNHDAAWNLELAQRRLVDVNKKQDEKKKQEEQDKKDEDKKDEEKKDEEQKKDGEENKDGEKKDGDKGNDDKANDQDKKPEDAPKDAPQDKPTDKPDAPKPKPEDESQKPSKSEDADDKPKDAQQALPKPMQQALDALANGEENLEKVRARMRAARQPRRVQKDW